VVAILEKCPHCGEQTEVEAPEEECEAGDEVECARDCTWCAMPLVAVFKVEAVLQDLREA
jgi:hypothetical protein